MGQRTVLWSMSLLLIVGCGSSFHVPEKSPGHPLDGFTVLKVPRRSIPIGAQWHQELGPNGAGAEEQNLTRAASYAVLRTDERLGGEISGNILRVLNLSAGAKSATSVVMQDIELVRVSNLRDIELRADTSLLYEGVRVGKMVIETTGNYSGELAAANLYLLGDFSVEAKAGAHTKLEARDVYVAYRVVRLLEPEVSRVEARLPGSVPVRLRDYKVEVHATGAVRCACPYTEDGRYLNGPPPIPRKLNECVRSNPLFINVENAKQGAFGKGSLRMDFAHPWGRAGAHAVTLDTRELSGRIEVDELEVAATFSQMVLSNCLVYGASLFNEDASYLRLTTIRYEFEPLQEPSAGGGW